MMHSTTVRRSCQPSAGPTGSPVTRSHTTVLARWLRDADGRRPAPSAAADRLGGGVEHRPRHRRGVELDEPGERRRRWVPATGLGDDRQGVVDDRRPQAGRADIDDEDRGHRARLSGGLTSERRRLVPWRSITGRAAAEHPGPEGDGQVEHDGDHRTSATDQPDDEEHGLGDDVRADGHDQAVAERGAAPLVPGGARRRRGRSRRGRPGRAAWPAPPSSRLVGAPTGAAIENGTANTRPREPPARDRVPVPARSASARSGGSRPRGPARTATGGRACRG